MIFDELAVAVVHENDQLAAARVRIEVAAQPRNLGDWNRRSPLVPARALHVHEAYRGRRSERRVDRFEVKAAADGERHLIVRDAPVTQAPTRCPARALAAAQPNNLLERVVIRPADSEHHIAGPQCTKKRARDRVRPAEELESDERRLRAHEPRDHAVELLAADVAVTVTVDTVERGRVEPLCAERVEHAVDALACLHVNLPEPSRESRRAVGTQGRAQRCTRFRPPFRRPRERG